MLHTEFLSFAFYLTMVVIVICLGRILHKYSIRYIHRKMYTLKRQNPTELKIIFMVTCQFVLSSCFAVSLLAKHVAQNLPKPTIDTSGAVLYGIIWITPLIFLGFKAYLNYLRKRQDAINKLEFILLKEHEVAKNEQEP